MRTIFRTFILYSALASFVFCADEKMLDWSKAQKIRKGVRLVHLELTEPRLMKVDIMRIDLSMQGLKVTSTQRDEDWGKPMPDCPKHPIRTRRQRTVDFMKDARKPAKDGGRGLEMIVAANSSPWQPWEAPYTHKYADPVGLAITDGVVVADNANGPPAVFVVWKNGDIDIVESIPKEQYGKVWLAANGFGICLKDGKDCPDGGYEAPLMPRIVFGLSKDRHWMFIMTIDGRQKDWSLGANGTDIKRLMRQAGAWDAIDMDGGGSATLCWWDDEKGPVVVNRHTANGYTRPTGLNLGFYLLKKPR